MKYSFKHLTHANQVFLEYPLLKTIYYEAVDLHQLNGGSVIHPPLSPEQIMMFIVYAYWEKSEIATELSIHKRRQLALELIGFELKTLEQMEANKNLVAMVVGASEFNNRLALHFCKMHNNIDWIELCRLQDLVDDAFLAAKEEVPESEKGRPMTATELLLKKAELEKRLEPFRNTIRTLASQIFAGDKDLLNMASSHLILEKRKRIITPENYATAMLGAGGDASKIFA